MTDEWTEATADWREKERQLHDFMVETDLLLTPQSTLPVTADQLSEFRRLEEQLASAAARRDSVSV